MSSNHFKTFWVLVLTGVFVYLGVVNFQRRLDQRFYDDGIQWSESAQGLLADHVFGSNLHSELGAVIEPGDRLLAVDGHVITVRADYLALQEALEARGEGASVEYRIAKQGGGPEVLLSGPVRLRNTFQAIDYVLPIPALIFLLAGVLIQIRSWKSPRAFHFFLIGSSAFVLLFYRPSGLTDGTGWTVWWADEAAWLLLPALLLHFCLSFPKASPLLLEAPRLRALIYLPAVLLLAGRALWWQGKLQPFGLPANESTASLLDRIDALHLAVFLAAACVAVLHQRRSSDTLQRQQIKWFVYGTLAGVVPFAGFYLLPAVIGFHPGTALQLSVLSLGLIPLGFGYAITRYRLMDVDLIFKRGLAYTVTSSALMVFYVGLVLLLGRALQSFQAPGDFTVFAIAALIAALIFSPLKNRIQEQIDRYFDGERFDSRRSFSDFGRTLGHEIQLAHLADRICKGVKGALGVSSVTVFLRDEKDADLFRPYRGSENQSPDRSLRFPRELLTVTSPIQISFSRLSEKEAEVGAFSDWGIEYIQPLTVRGRAIGFMGLGRRSDGGLLNSDELELVSAMAQYGAVALDNALLFDSLETKTGQLSRLKAYSENVVESITVGVAVVDPEGGVTVWNAAMSRIWGIGSEQALGLPLESLLPDDLIESLRGMLDGPGWSVSDTRRLLKTRLEGPDGQNRLANVTMTPFLGHESIPGGLLVLLEDITEKVRLENQLQQAEKLSSIGLFAAGIAHEVNTPLAGISSYAQMLLEGTSPEHKDYELLRKIEAQSFRASKIVNNLLKFARIRDSEVAEVGLNNLLVDTVSLLEHQFQKGAVEVDLQLDPYLPKTLGEGGKLQQVFMNVLLNAKDAMPEGGQLSVKTFRLDSTAVIEVSDTGCGISEQDQKRIYDPFFTTKEVGKGTGLGLSVSYGIIQEHSGRIQVKSRQGEGTTFRIELPVNRVN